MSGEKTQLQKLLQKIRRFFKREPEMPEDPYFYVSAPKKPRLPGRSAAAVADVPED